MTSFLHNKGSTNATRNQVSVACKPKGLPKNMKYQEQLQVARDKYLDHPEGKGLGTLARLELGAWLTEGFCWDWYTTHTFADENISQGLANNAWQRWLNSLVLQCKAMGMPRPHYVRATEHQENRPGRTIHYHALVGGVGNIKGLMVF